MELKTADIKTNEPERGLYRKDTEIIGLLLCLVLSKIRSNSVEKYGQSISSQSRKNILMLIDEALYTGASLLKTYVIERVSAG